MHILIINGPNLQVTGRRETEIYGSQSFESYLPLLSRRCEVELTYRQTNHEGTIIDLIYEAESMGIVGIILNAGAYTHTSIAIADAIRAIELPVVEVHLSNTAARESYRKQSFVAPHCIGSITGFGLYGYEMGVKALIHHSSEIQK